MNNLSAQTAYVGSTEITQVRKGDRLVLAPGGDKLWYDSNEIPSLDLRFADRKDLVDAITGSNLINFTRASSATYVGSDGLIKTATTNEARFDHDPTTGESLGLLVEEQRTNGIRNNTMVGAVAGTPGTLPTNWSAASSAAGISFEVVGVGTESGISYIDIRAYGTPAANGSIQISLEQNATNAAASGETWTISSYCRLMGGTLPGTTTLLARIGGSGGSFLTSSLTTIVPTGSSLISQRFTHVAALSNASTEFITARIDTAVFSGVPVDFTLRIGMPQLEKGAFATSVIPTTSSTVTRSADVASISGSNFSSWYNQSEGTVFYEGQVLGSDQSSNKDMLGLSDGTSNEFAKMFIPSGSNQRFRVDVGGVTQVLQNAISTDVYSPVKAAFALKLNSTTCAGNGIVQSEDTSCLIPTVDRFVFGELSTGEPELAARYKRLTYWPQRLPDSTLETITE